MSFLPAIPGWAWAIVLLIPLAIFALYFLKLKRAPLVVPSTYLWKRTIEDLHVNSFWQRLQKNILLYIQLLAVALALLGLLRPGCRSSVELGERSIFLIDHSASMSATDASPNRLAQAKEKALQMIDTMDTDDVGMVIAFSDRAEIKQGFTSDRRQLRTAVENITPTNRITDIREALRAASGLANPGRTSEVSNVNDIQVAEALPAKIYILSDGGFPDIDDFDLGNLSAEYFPIGTDSANNISIVAFTAERTPDRPNEIEIYGRLVNHSNIEQTVATELYLNDDLLDATQVKLAAGEEKGVSFQLNDIEQGDLEFRITAADHLAIDNAAYTTLAPPKPVEVLLVTAGNKSLELGLGTTQASKISRTKIVEPVFLETPDYARAVEASSYDLVIFDMVSPKKMPACNTLFFGAIPPVEGWSLGETASPIFVIDILKDHPLMQYLEMSTVRMVEGQVLFSPDGGTKLIEADCGQIMATAPRGPFIDVVCSVPLLRREQEAWVANTDWPIRRSFPIFLLNILETLGNTSADSVARSILPGQPISLAVGASVNEVQVELPDGSKTQVPRGSLSQFTFTQTDNPGIHRVTNIENLNLLDRFAVNLFSLQEGSLKPTEKITFGAETVLASNGSSPSRTEFWRWLTLLAVGLLVTEWLVYLRRVHY